MILRDEVRSGAPMDISARLNAILDAALSKHADVRSIVVASPQGLPIASRSKVSASAASLAAYAALLDDAGVTVFRELSLLPLKEAMLVGPKGVVYQVRGEGSNHIVLLSALGEPNLGLLRMVAREVEAEIGIILQRFLA